MRAGFALILFMFGINFVSRSDAGAWTSGGGELIQTANNPWFLKKGGEVNYCLAIDENNFGISVLKARELLQGAFLYWQEQLPHSFNYSISGLGKMEVADIFREKPCSESPELYFQFGILNQQQIKYLQDPRKYIGIAVRTHYDEAKMRAQGFIYVSPMKGPLKLENSNSERVELPWSQGEGGLLEKVLIHELGHVFGLQHFGSAYDLMNAGFLEHILHKDYYNFFSQRGSGSNVFRLGYQEGWAPLSCSSQLSGTVFQRFFGIPLGWRCYYFQFQKMGLNEQTEFQLFAKESDDALSGLNYTLIGTGKISLVNGPRSLYATSISVPKGQSLFPVFPMRQSPVAGPMVVEALKQGTYTHSKSGEMKDVFATLRPNEVVFGGILDEKIYFDLKK